MIDRQFVRKGRIVGQAGGNGARTTRAVAVLMLQAFARQRRAAGRAAHQETFAARIGEGPDQVAHALESEHRIVDEERNHRHAVVGVRRAGGGETRHRAGLGDSFFENLAVLRFLVVQEHVAVHGLVQLALAGVDADLPEQRFHAECAGFVGNDRHDQLADLRILQQSFDDADEGRGGRSLAAARTLQRFLESVELAARSSRSAWRARASASIRPAPDAAPADISSPDESSGGR